MLIDTHIHVGQFFNLYFAPADIHSLMTQLNISYYAVSSTSMCEENYTKVLDELRELIAVDGDKVLPVMWITPEGLKGNIAWLLESDIPWRMIKIHPFLNSETWQCHPELIDEVIDIASEMNLPLLIHTGNEESCQCQMFEKYIIDNPNIQFILAHGRPHNEALRLAGMYKNVYVDSAFMPVPEMAHFLEEGLDDRLLWGTDMCIPKYFYPEQVMRQYYLEKLNKFRSVCSEEQFMKVTALNAVKLFHLND